MKKPYALLLALPLLCALAACDKPADLSSNAKNSINDALDRRPQEKIRDAAEDAGDAIKKGAGDVKDAVKDAVK
ncbi:MAG: hypothetical protein WAR41_04335 [Azonexus sp.]|jgi:hypothetical protein